MLGQFLFAGTLRGSAAFLYALGLLRRACAALVSLQSLIKANPLSGSLPLHRCAGASLRVILSVGLTCASKRRPAKSAH